MIRWRELFFGRRDAVAIKLAIGLVANAGLLAHGFAPNAVLAGFTDAALEWHQRFGAYHAFFGGFSHAGILPGTENLPIRQLTNLICLGCSRINSNPYCGWSLIAPVISTSLFSNFAGA